MLGDLSDIISVAGEAFDDILNKGSPCVLIYHGNMEPCVNCVYDPIGKKSAGRFRDGGPLSFAEGTICPVCGGGGIRMTETTDTIKMTIDYNLTGESKKFKRVTSAIVFSETAIRTRGFITDLPKIQKCSEMVIADTNSPYYNWKYKLISEPVDDFVFVRNKYFSAYWERAG